MLVFDQHLFKNKGASIELQLRVATYVHAGSIVIIAVASMIQSDFSALITSEFERRARVYILRDL